MNAPTRLEPAALDAVLDAVLASNPNAAVAAINETGFFVPMPSSVPLTGQNVIRDHLTGLELVVPEDRTVLIKAWTDAHLNGAAHASVHLANDPEQRVTLRYVDATHRHGVYIGMFEVDGDVDLVAAFQNIPTSRPKVALVQKDQTALVLQIDDATSEILGWSREEMVGRRSLEFVEPEDQPRAIANWMDMLHAPGARRRVRLRHRHRDGSWIWFELTNHNLLDDPGYGYVLTEMVDITDEMAAQESLRAREHLLRRLTELLPLGIFQVDAARRIVYRNARLASILGTRHADSIDTQLSGVVPLQRAELEDALNAVLLDGADRDLEVGIRRRGQHLRRCTLSLRALTDESGAVTGAIVCVADVTESVRMREELEDRATFDVLTRCYNRASILHALERTLAEQEGGGDSEGTGVIFVDLDRFKDINDRLGHAAGDAFLVEVARRLTRATSGADLVGRIGGDEFLVVCTRVADEMSALKISERIADTLSGSEINLGTERITPRASIGFAWSNSQEIDADSLVARADMAMYESKRLRLGRPVRFSEATARASHVRSVRRRTQAA